MYEEMDSLIEKASILIEALPYIQKLYGKTVVIKYGGNAMINEKLKNWVMEDITLLKYIGVNPIVVHGGGPDINSVLKKLNVESQFVNGLRVTDMQTMEVAQMVLVGKTNKELVSMLNQKGGKAIGICGIDGNLIQARKHYEYVNGEKIDLGYVGEVVSINAKVLEMLAKDEYIPVVAPIGVGEDGTSYNINADTVAAEIAKAIKAEKLMFMTDVEGLKYDKNSKKIISAISADEVLKMIEEGKIDGGMIPKVLGCIDALKHGVNRTHILDGRIPHCILLEIFTDKGIGTMIHL
ncbi:N-acetylglutamate kinase [Caldicellulosiruptor bescii]|uniref:Acetylglutamate kinase n=2 Tax=Caldicellulosiruptor bescii TaxID=31899 RepID=ARGB_CALBD|nr:acetylglutamate kinase [Caldicellulosiruptor bescii]B9MR75.1 RecName: Full=Acetylglutamate kinase; AltName: Full=N-acetyl-L-glutamate 5-phosphotransferase; AltName: Full=NAG kinase; Short=NAGK [Caldicellulosiruptor bescii DSM 6725]ACM60179.1 acetylglutamate kinase [Caldicellulosiruptor bescii DSM 6725]PBC87594.1 N-acetylglutamate kinase [Caldicellulosiruptor bescii]PBC90527.1 N-acetylglutamate kinase [Caldicellulosiruptor bescii]PBD04041.1 N-acetylglutamate kinase [Caldicellulosiruptor besc